MSRLLVLTAVDVEGRGLADRLGLPIVPGAARPRYRGGRLDIVVVGPGARHLTDLAGAAPPAGLVLSAGICGGLAPGLREGALVVPEAVIAPDGHRRATAEVRGLARAGTIVTVAEVVKTPAAKSRMWMETGALACDMESAVILTWAAQAGLPALVVRGVADTAERGIPDDLAALAEPDGRVRTVRAVRAVLARPGAAAEALALRRGTNAALDAVAGAIARLAREVG